MMSDHCISCHTVGYGKGGFVDEATTPNLTNIQCENCHGPGSLHVAGNGDKTKILSGEYVLSHPEICGQCHTGSYHGHYDEWKTSPHAEVTTHVAGYMAQGKYVGQCGLCHSGLARYAVKDEGQAPASLNTTQFGAQAATTGQTCGTCHDAMSPTGNGMVEGETEPQIDMQLKYPTYSTAFYTLDYDNPEWNDNINVCGQCHNGRNAHWQETSRPPHHNPQYLMLIGDVGKWDGSKVVSDPAPADANSAHRTIMPDNGRGGQCTHCHMYASESTSPHLKGHYFRVDYRGCAPCHTADDAGNRKAATQDDIRQRMDGVVARLNNWGATMSPAALQSKYGKLAWEYSNPGEFSNPNDDSTIVGPTSAEQAGIPDAIKQARFDLYIVLHDGSYGVHNAKFARYLLDQANAKLTAIGVP